MLTVLVFTTVFVKMMICCLQITVVHKLVWNYNLTKIIIQIYKKKREIDLYVFILIASGLPATVPWTLIPSLFGFTSIWFRSHIDLTSIPHRSLVDSTSISLRHHFKFTSVSLFSLRPHFDFTSISLRFKFAFTSISHRSHFGSTSIS